MTNTLAYYEMLEHQEGSPFNGLRSDRFQSGLQILDLGGSDDRQRRNLILSSKFEMLLLFQILCHSHWLVDDTKMSKSKGNVVDPLKLVDQFTPEGIR